MDYYQGVVAEYLRANRATFINPEFLLQLEPIAKMPARGASWYVDLLAISLKERAAFLCEVTYSRSLSALLKRLSEWSRNWPRIIAALQRDACISRDWVVRTWLFIPEAAISRLLGRLPSLPIDPRITPLEMTQPWRYCGWDRPTEGPKPDVIPPTMV